HSGELWCILMLSLMCCSSFSSTAIAGSFRITGGSIVSRCSVKTIKLLLGVTVSAPLSGVSQSSAATGASGEGGTNNPEGVPGCDGMLMVVLSFAGEIQATMIKPIELKAAAIRCCFTLI